MRREAGFTLIEVVLAMVLLATMMALLYSGLTFALRSWDAADANGRRVADRRLAQNFLRREVAEIFPMRWKDPMRLRFAFEGQSDTLRFVSTRAAGVTLGGLSLVGLRVENGKDNRTRDLVMRRAMADPDVEDFAPLDRAEATLLYAGIDGVAFSYFGSGNDFTEPAWSDKWEFTNRMPQLIRLRVRDGDGHWLPDVVMKLGMAEEAGCLENAFQRGCLPRRPTTP
jgi:general secretion pathway protein J